MLCGDSEIAEGSVWEAFEHASFYGLDNLTAIIDVNRLGQRGETMHGWNLDSYADRARAFGWNAIEIDGHDVEAIDRAYAEAVETEGVPTVIVAKTIKGKGVKEVENKPNWHGKALDNPEQAIEELGGERNIVVELAKPDYEGEPHVFESGPLELPTWELGEEVATRLAYGEALVALGGGQRQGRRARRRGQQLDLRRALRQGLSGALLRDVHRRAAAGRSGRRPPGAQLGAVCVDLRGVLLARVRLRPHGRDQPGEHPPRRARTPGFRSARTGRRRWRSRISR